MGWTNLVTISWLFVSFGESRSAALALADWSARRPCFEPRFPDTCSSKVVHFYLNTRAYELVRGGFTSHSTHVTKSDDEPVVTHFEIWPT